MVLYEDWIAPLFPSQTFLVLPLNSSLVEVLGKPILSDHKSFPLG